MKNVKIIRLSWKLIERKLKSLNANQVCLDQIANKIELAPTFRLLMKSPQEPTPLLMLYLKKIQLEE